MLVPLNWLEPVEGENAKIALTLFPAKKEKRKGTMIVNPGGPGTSGTYYISRAGAALSVLVEDQYDILGFDPRGVNLSSPHIFAFDSEFDYEVIAVPNGFSLAYDATVGLMVSNSVDYTIDERQVKKSLQLNKLIYAKTAAKTTDRARRSLSTAFAARDMLALIDALGERKLTYYGFSYGTVIGATFAAMFPSKVDKMVLDGVVHAGDFTNDIVANGKAGSTDSRKTLHEFYRRCAEAKTYGCALATTPSGRNETASTDMVREKVEGLLSQLWYEPMAVQDADGIEGGLITQTSVYRMMFRILMKPSLWSDTASAIAAAIASPPNGTSLLSLIRQTTEQIPSSSQKTMINGLVVGDSHEIAAAVFCADSGASTYNMTVDDWILLGADLRDRSLFGEVFREMYLPCASFKDGAFERYSGPWTKEEGLDLTGLQNKVLFVGNTADPMERNKEQDESLLLEIPAKSQPSNRKLLALIIISILSALTASLYPDTLLISATSTKLASSQIIRNPTSLLKWSECEGETGFLCSSIKVPLNWAEPVEGEFAEVALMMWPAQKEKRKGTMLVNPGGPGGSGTSYVSRAGKGLSVLTSGVYDILGFDPRGINRTSPQVYAFDSEYDHAVYTAGMGFELSHDATLKLNLSDPLDYADEERQVKKSLKLTELIHAKTIAKVGEKTMKTVSTAFVARDMKAILDALGKGEEDLIYWGMSYGTVLGATFSAMFPDRVHRVVVDGVCDSISFTNDIAAFGRSAVVDSQSTLDQFYERCAAAGPDRCALSPPSTFQGTSEEGTDVVRGKVAGLMSQLWSEPIVVFDSEWTEGGLITQTDLHSMLFRILYAPTSWQVAATAIAQAIASPSNATSLLLEVRKSSSPIPASRKVDKYKGRIIGEGNENFFSVYCSDTEPAGNFTVDDWIAIGADVMSKSMIGEKFREMLIGCASFTDRAYERFSGPWTKRDGLQKTKNKVLFVGNTWDPVTPLASARLMVDSFGLDSASLLIHHGRGHCSVAEPSLCTAKYIREYLVDGVVPDHQTECEPVPDFVFPPSNSTNIRALSVEDADLIEALGLLERDTDGRFSIW